jgi:DedD protein
MGLFSFLSKNKQDGAKGSGEFYSRAEDGGASPARSRKRKQTKADKPAGGATSNVDSDGPLDPVLPEKKRARRRLVGAVALVLAMIIGLPMILDSEPKPMNDDIAIQIPSRDKVPAADPGTALPLPAVAPTPTPASANASIASATSAASTANTGNSAVPVASSLGPHEQVVNMPADVKKPAEVKPAEVKPATVADKPAKPADKAADKPADKPAEKLAEKLAEKPADKQTAKTEHKVDAAEEARAAAILNGNEVDKPADKADKKPGKFVVQVAALTSKEKISELQSKLNDAGFKPLLQTVPTDAGVTTRVRVGPFASKEEAETARAKLTKLGLGGKLLPL